MRLLLALLTILLATPALAADPDLILRGELTGADHETYRKTAFDVPAGVTRVTVEVAATGKERRTVVDLGVMDGERFRGWSGGTRTRFTLSAEDATPGYLRGPIRPGRWTLLMGLPNVRKDSRDTYEAKVWFERGESVAGFSDTPLKTGRAWWRGDLHMHTGHSDGSCLGVGGQRTPCPLYKTVERARGLGLDFVSITDHNTTAHFDFMRELQPSHPDLLLMPGREITTFLGHANVFGPTRFIDFKLAPGDTTVGALLDDVATAGGVISINHPALPSGEACMGCGWVAKDTDYAKVQAIEVVNGGTMKQVGDAEGMFSAIAFWETQLNAGYRLTAIGGSDNHDADQVDGWGAIGRPVTVIQAAELSTPALLDGVRAGRVFIDMDGVKGRTLDLTARAGEASAAMGGVLAVRAGTKVRFAVQSAGVEGARIEVVTDGVKAPGEAAFERNFAKGRHWVRVNIRAADGRLLLIGNPIYVEAT
ncbi:CehA/McbA family metallohydrolase [Caulobacter sp. NIBR2454]|uniref:CehA/McbA family metallohydrolase n=1 Tax=Caulobacter sp. NIBR2454 TaxID=3015996 RepID=UPI0022B720AD|nr:CehA/McbA family metallohydrolase [Caulobacter sp. NIBR2454]